MKAHIYGEKGTKTEPCLSRQEHRQEHSSKNLPSPLENTPLRNFMTSSSALICHSSVASCFLSCALGCQGEPSLGLSNLRCL